MAPEGAEISKKKKPRGPEGPKNGKFRGRSDQRTGKARERFGRRWTEGLTREFFLGVFLEILRFFFGWVLRRSSDLFFTSRRTKLNVFSFVL